MGTQYHISIVHSLNHSLDKQELKNRINEILWVLNQQVSTYIFNSEISKFNQSKKTDWFPISADFLQIIKAAQKVSQITQGVFDISISPLVELWGFGPETKVNIPNTVKLQEVKTHIGFQLLEIQDKPPLLKKKDELLRIDLSAIAKGFAVDKISTHLSEQGFTNHLVEIGGEIRASGTNQLNKKWRVAIEDPNENTQIAKNSIEISNQAVATSGDYRNYYVENGERFSHIINPKTGYPIKHKLASVTVLHESAMMADAYSTALMAMGEETGKEFVKKHDLRAYMIIREKDAFRIWSSID